MVKLVVSPDCIPFQKLSAQPLINAIVKILNNTQYRDRAVQLSKLIQQENGVKTAADIIEEKINNFG